MSHGLHWVLRDDLIQFLLSDANLLAVSRFVALLAAIMADPGLMRITTLMQLAPVDPILLLREVGKGLK